MSRLSLVVALLATAAAGLPAQGRSDFGRADWCAEYRDREPSHCVVREETLSGTAMVDVDASRNGGIHVRGWDRPDTHLRARIAASARSEDRARELAEAVRLDTAGGRIRATGPDTDGGEHWHVSFELQVPRNGQVRLQALNGGIALEEFGGSAAFQTSNGGLTLRNVSGDIRGETTNGGITVELSGTRWDGRGLDVSTRNGGVTMRIPDGYSAELETSTVNGGLRIDFPVTVQGDLSRGRRISTRLGSGGARIRATTMNGGVTITRRPS
jgi:hypothetical protein